MIPIVTSGENVYIQVYSPSGSALMQVPVTRSCQHVQQLSQSDYIKLSWVSDTGTMIPAGAYILGDDSEHYALLEPYKPSMTDEATYRYEPQFTSRFFSLSKVPFFMYDYDGQGHITLREPDWSLTDTAGNFMLTLRKAILNETGLKYNTVVGSDITVGSKTVTFNASDIISGANAIANAFETEIWLEKYPEPDANEYIGKIHLSKASLGTASSKVLTVGTNVGVPSVKDNGKFYNRFYAFGSSRNITQDYMGSGVNNVATKRLTLNPTDYPDGYKDCSNGGTVQTIVLQFDDIYPSASNIVLYNVRVRMKWRIDDNGQKIPIGEDSGGNTVYDSYGIWYAQLKYKNGSTYTDFDFNNTNYDPEDNPTGMRIAGLTPSFHFNSGPLTGREFEVIYHETGKTVQEYADQSAFQILAGDFEIVFTQEGNLIIPTVNGLIPDDDDKVVLFNVRMPDIYITDAQDRLEAALLKEINDKYIRLDDNGDPVLVDGQIVPVDRKEYTVNSYSDIFHSTGISLAVGDAVTFAVGNTSFESRVTSLTKQIDFPDEQNITVGNEIIKGALETLQEDAKSANQNIDLLAAINEASKSIVDAYGRTQQTLIEGFNSIANMWQIQEDNSVKLNPDFIGVWAEGFMSAGGESDTGGGGGGGGVNLSAVWDSLKSNASGDYAYNMQIHSGHLTSALSGYLTSASAASTYQPLDADLTSIAGLSGTSGLLKKTAANTWTLDTNTYLTTSSASSTYQPLDADLTAIAGLSGTSGLLKKTAANTWSLDTTSYATTTALDNYLLLAGGVMTGPISGVTYLTVNAAAQTSYRFKVNGTSNLGGNTSITGTLTVGTTTTNKDTTLNGGLSVTGTSTLTGLLTANGGITVPSGKSITLGSGVLEWDSTNSAWKLTGNFYATGWVSAGGASSTGGGGGGGGINLEAMWSNLQTNASGTTGYNLQIDYHHLPTIEYSGTGFVKSAAYRKSGDTNYITFTRSALAASDIPDLSSTYVTVATAQTITAQHTFSNGLKLNTATSWTSGDRALYFGTTTDDSNIRYYYTDSSKGLTYNPSTGALKAGSFVKRSNSGGFLKADGTEDTTSYLPLAGGTMTGDIVMTNGEYINASNNYAMLGLNGEGTTFFCGPGYTVSNSFLIRSANINLTHRKHTAASTYTDYIIYDASNLTQSVVTGLIGNSTYAPYVSGGYLPLSGGTMTGSPILTNAIYLRSNDTGGTARAIIGLNSDNQLLVGYGTAGQGYETHLYGGSIEFHYGSARTTGLTLNSSGQLVKANDTPYAAYDTGGTVRTLMSLNASNIVWIAYGAAGAGYNTNLCGNQIEFKYGTGRTTGFTLDSSGNCTATGYIAVGTGGASGSKIASDTASNIYLANSSGAVLVCASKVVRRGTSLADVSLGNSSYPWGGIYSTTGDFSDVVTMANTKAIQWLNTSNTAVSAMYLSSSNNLIIGYGLIAGGGNAYLYGTNIHLRYSSSSTGFLMDSSGKVGIGFSDNTNMYRKFNVSGDMLIRGTASGTPGRLVIGNGTHNATGGAGEILFQEYALETETTSGARNGFKIAATHATSADRNDLKFYCSNVGTSPYAPSWTALMTLRYNSRVGILNETPAYALDVTGTIHSTVGIFSDGYVSAGGVSSSSDARLKTDLKDIDLSVDQIADAPAITFKWKNETTSPRHAGSLAQYWEKVIPEVVSEVANHLTLDYGATALLSSITIAKAVKNHEERIKELEEENKQLKAKVYALG